MINLEAAELHSVVFVAGTNLGPKLLTKRTDRPGLKLEYDRKHRELRITYKEKSVIIPRENVMWMQEIMPEKEGAPITPFQDESPKVGPIKAQYDTPMSHVFAGPGAGKTGS